MRHCMMYHAMSTDQALQTMVESIYVNYVVYTISLYIQFVMQYYQLIIFKLFLLCNKVFYVQLQFVQQWRIKNLIIYYFIFFLFFFLTNKKTQSLHMKVSLMFLHMKYTPSNGCLKSCLKLRRIKRKW